MTKALRREVVSDSCSLLSHEYRCNREMLERTHSSHESLDEFRSIGNEEIEVLVDGEDSHDSVLPDVRVAMFLNHIALSAQV